MTADERLEALLNRAGQTISDLPKPTKTDYAHTDKEALLRAMWAAMEFQGDDPAMWPNYLTGTVYQLDFILHLTDVIDRMETALENACGERDYLRQIARVDSCWTCVHSVSGNKCSRPGSCTLGDDGRCTGYEYAGVPEGWRAE